MAKAPKKAWQKAAESKAPVREIVSLPYLHNDEESIRLRKILNNSLDGPKI